MPLPTSTKTSEEKLSPPGQSGAMPRPLPRRLWRRVRRLTLIVLGLALLFTIGLWLAARLLPLDTSNLNSGEISTILFDRKGRTLRPFLGGDERWRIPVQLDEISPWLIQATLAVEDKRYYRHFGIDPMAVCRAAVSDLIHGHVVSGASTITMQVAALNDLTDHDVFRKARQAFRALQLESRKTKREILELYFTNAPYGGNICGAEAAARRYFGKSAAELSLPEAALLAGVPQSPSRLRPDRNLKGALRRRQTVLKQMLVSHVISRQDYERALAVVPHVGIFAPPAEAPHFCDLLHQLYPRATRVRTTLDRDLQKQAEQQLRSQVDALASRGVTNGSVVVLDNASGDVLAMVGSLDYHSEAIDGQVNGATSPRSPGSALKPLIYALAYDLGTLTPAGVLCDVPQQYPGYDPQNFDKQFRGLVPADKALAWSLNIPAIEILQQVGVGRAMRSLRTFGITSLRDTPDEYGLSLAIGTCGVRLLELANAYAAIARGGTFRPYRLLLTPQSRARFTSASAFLEQAAEPPREKRLLSEAACYFVTNALSDPRLRPPEGVAPELLGLEGIAWKTGTSSGFRDAWTFAYSCRYTVGVWIGNFDGHPSRALVGAEAAAPVALRLLKSLHSSSSGNVSAPCSDWPKRPGQISRVVVCSETGLSPSPDCPTTRTVEMASDAGQTPGGMPGSLPARCQIHRRVRVDRETGEMLCTRCMTGRTYDERVFSFWPMAVSSWLAQNGSGVATPPPHYRGCASVAGSPAPRITSPKQGDSFIVSKERSLEAQKLAFQAVCPPGTAKLYWFIDDELFQAGEAASAAYYLPQAGRHSVKCVDEAGRSDTVEFHVEAE